MHKLILFISLKKLRQNLTIFRYLNFKTLTKNKFLIFFNYLKGFNLNYYSGKILKRISTKLNLKISIFKFNFNVFLRVFLRSNNLLYYF